MSDSDVEEQILDYEHEELSSDSEHDQGSGRATPVSQSGRAAAKEVQGADTAFPPANLQALAGAIQALHQNLSLFCPPVPGKRQLTSSDHNQAPTG